MQSTEPEAGRQPKREQLERVQIEHELNAAYEAALVFEHRLELAGMNRMARLARRMRGNLCLALAYLANGQVENRSMG
jgi:hypothetical protein